MEKSFYLVFERSRVVCDFFRRVWNVAISTVFFFFLLKLEIYVRSDDERFEKKKKKKLVELGNRTAREELMFEGIYDYGKSLKFPSHWLKFLVTSRSANYVLVPWNHVLVFIRFTLHTVYKILVFGLEPLILVWPWYMYFFIFC